MLMMYDKLSPYRQITFLILNVNINAENHFDKLEFSTNQELKSISLSES